MQLNSTAQIIKGTIEVNKLSILGVMTQIFRLFVFNDSLAELVLSKKLNNFRGADLKISMTQKTLNPEL